MLVQKAIFFVKYTLLNKNDMAFNTSICSHIRTNEADLINTFATSVVHCLRTFFFRLFIFFVLIYMLPSYFLFIQCK